MEKIQMKRRLAAAFLLLASCWGRLAAQTAGMVLVSGPGDGEEGAAMVCDGQLSTKWCFDSPRQMPYTIVLDAGREAAFAEYGLVTGDDTYAYPSRNPVSWRVYGSADGKEWTLVDSRKNDRSMGAENWQEYRFKPAHKGRFRYYRFEFSEMAGGTRIQLSEITLHETTQTAVKATFSQGTGRSGKEGSEMVCDGKLYTKWCIDAPNQMPYTVVLDAGGATRLSEYGLVTGDDTHAYPDRNPVSWRVSGSNDKQAWTLLDEQKYNRRLRDENEQEYRFKPATEAAFRYYRFEFTRMAGGTRLQLSEINLYKREEK